MPNAKTLEDLCTPRGAVTPIPLETVVAQTIQILKKLQDLFETFGAQFVSLVPPVMSGADSLVKVQSAATETKISVLIPFKPGEMPAAAFSDGFHINPNGARILPSD